MIADRLNADGLHLAGQWAVYALVLLHVAATAWHVAVRRDGLLSRMVPAQHPRPIAPFRDCDGEAA